MATQKLDATQVTNLSGTNTGDQTITLTGDVTGTGTGSFAATIASNAVTLAKMATQADQTFLGNNAGSTAVPTALASSTVKTMLNKVDGFAFNVTGKTLASERYLLGIAQYAFTVGSGNSAAKALVAATASTVFTIKKGTVASPTTIGTFTFAISGTTASVSISAGSVSSGDVVWIEAPASPDATLQDIAFVVRA